VPPRAVPGEPVRFQIQNLASGADAPRLHLLVQWHTLSLFSVFFCCADSQGDYLLLSPRLGIFFSSSSSSSYSHSNIIIAAAPCIGGTPRRISVQTISDKCHSTKAAAKIQALASTSCASSKDTKSSTLTSADISLRRKEVKQ